MKIKDVLLGIAIIILTIFVTYYGINTLFPKPQFEDFCDDANFKFAINNSLQCEEVGGKWSINQGPKTVDVDGRVIESQSYCDIYYTCNKEYNDVLKIRSRKVFYLALPIGITIVIAGAFFFGLEAVGAGLMGGGVGTLLYGAGAYWPYSENWIRFLLSLLGLAILVWFSYYFSRKLGKKEK